ncbi:ABC-type sugar transport system [Candidatus Moduliflexus flocculans]|uniref:ABC-type sugar transport system n=1 Tax=Candidatus Moduliflexus flocculans TaxID=1499966 RepID=A0A0S6VS89_9BACT|nr:ABC-type sugar transport system [Candidatus Moduliflexus flocculans]
MASLKKKKSRFSWSKLSPQLALIPALSITVICFIGASFWSILIAFTASREFPDYAIIGFKQFLRLFKNPLWILALKNVLFLGIGSIGSIVLGFLLAICMNKDIKGESAFRTMILYPLAVSLIITGLVWQWILNPGMGIQQYVRNLGFAGFTFDWIARPERVMYTVVMAAIWQSTGFYMVLLLAGLKGVDSEVWKAAKVDGIPPLRFYLEIIMPMMKYTFLTCIILLFMGVVKSYDLIVAMTNGGPGGRSTVPAYFILNAYFGRQNIGLASAGSALMLLFVVILLLILFVTNRILRRGDNQ